MANQYRNKGYRGAGFGSVECPSCRCFDDRARAFALCGWRHGTLDLVALEGRGLRLTTTLDENVSL